jgi:hypothetical protein
MSTHDWWVLGRQSRDTTETNEVSSALRTGGVELRTYGGRHSRARN